MLELGGKYLTRDRTEKVRIVRKHLKSDPSYQKTHPFVDSEGYAYMRDGRSHPTKFYPFDLIEKV